MKATLKRQIYPKKGQIPPSNGFTISLFTCNESIGINPQAIDENGENLYGQDFIVKGHFLPSTSAVQYELEGSWAIDSRGRSFVVTSCVQEVEKTSTGIISYLLSGVIKGIGPVTATKIFDKFGLDTLEILDSNPSRLLEVSGVSEAKMDKIISSYIESRGAKDVISKLAPLGISTSKCISIYERFKGASMDTINNSPYKLVQIKGVSFAQADNIAIKVSTDNNSAISNVDRASAALTEVLNQAENGGPLYFNAGHLCISYIEWQQKAMDLMSATNIAPPNSGDFSLAIKQMVDDKLVILQKDYNDNYFVYKFSTAEAEFYVAKNIMRLDSKANTSAINGLTQLIQEKEMKENISLAPQQMEAVISGLSNNFSVITGGPGTGKTTIINFIRDIYSKTNAGSTILMCAPSAKASRRMSESTGYPASTIHKALGLLPGDEHLDVEELDYDLIIVDEFSMTDVFLSRALFSAIKDGAKVCIIGDVDQLPSVGPGCVLADIIDSNVISVSRLTDVYRQSEDSKIAINAKLIKGGNSQLDFDDSFQFIPAHNFQIAATEIEKIYLKEVAAMGVKDITILSPFKSDKTATGVNPINQIIRDRVNPHSSDRKEIKVGSKTFRVEDKVIQTKNVDNISNGDIGYILDITGAGSNAVITIDFSDGMIVDYAPEDMMSLELAYATTVHKSQGSEYDIVVFNLLKGHTVMLQRNLLYTAITRAKQRVYIVGEQAAIAQAIAVSTEGSGKRNTMLQHKLIQFKKGAA